MISRKMFTRNPTIFASPDQPALISKHGILSCQSLMAGSSAYLQIGLHLHSSLFTDASAAAYAAVLGSHWIHGFFPPSWKDTNILIIELLPIVLAVHYWASPSDSRILFHCDNQAIVAVINKQTSQDNITMSLILSLVFSCLKYSIMFVAKHIPGKHNVIADLLSRSQFTAAQKINPALDKTPQQIPATCLPW